MSVTASAARAESTPRLVFAVEGAEPLRHAAAPTVAFALAIDTDLPVRSLSLNVQIRIAPVRRVYEPGDEDGLVDLFGTRARWGETMRSFLWTNATLVVPPFDRSARAELTVACTYDLDVAAAKYFRALGEGEVPLELLFSGTAFYLGDGGFLRTAQIPWDSEAAFGMPVRVWREAMESHFPGSAWLRVRRDVFDRLATYRAARALPTWESVLEQLLEGR